MDMLLNPFKQALKAGRLQIGLWHSLASHLAVEILADSGFDWISWIPSTRRTNCRWCIRSFRRWAAERRMPLFGRPGTIK